MIIYILKKFFSLTYISLYNSPYKDILKIFLIYKKISTSNQLSIEPIKYCYFMIILSFKRLPIFQKYLSKEHLMNIQCLNFAKRHPFFLIKNTFL